MLQLTVEPDSLYVQYFFYMCSNPEIVRAMNLQAGPRTVVGLAMEWIKNLALKLNKTKITLEDQWTGQTTVQGRYSQQAAFRKITSRDLKRDDALRAKRVDRHLPTDKGEKNVLPTPMCRIRILRTVGI